jgi:ABC-type xylose transport system substrate-binding protein
MNAESAVLEEVLRRAMDDGMELAKKDKLSEREEGEILAYFSLLDWGKQQAELLGIKFGDQELQSFDPYQLLNGSEQRKSA